MAPTRSDSEATRYEFVEHLASGGMGDLSIANLKTNTGILRRVVTKRLRADLVEDVRARAMLLDEARIAATLYHDNIVQVLDVLEDDRAVVLVLEYFPGLDLAQLLDLREQPLDYAHACAIVADVARALHYAHERSDDGGALGIVHRDVSLPNVLLGDHGTVKLTDFGVAKARSRSYVTRSETLKGKLGYMPPEQIRGGDIDRRADVFALGVVLFETTTGVPMFTADTDYETMRRILEAEPPEPARVRAGFPEELAAIIRAAVARDPAARFPTAAAMLDAIRRCQHTHAWHSTPAELARLVADQVPANVPPWHRARALGTATAIRTSRWHGAR